MPHALITLALVVGAAVAGTTLWAFGDGLLIRGQIVTGCMTITVADATSFRIGDEVTTLGGHGEWVVVAVPDAGHLYVGSYAKRGFSAENVGGLLCLALAGGCFAVAGYSVLIFLLEVLSS